MPRTADRDGFTAPTRIRLIETDLDHIDQRFDDLDARVDGIKNVLTGLLIAIATSAVLLAVNLVVSGGGS